MKICGSALALLLGHWCSLQILLQLTVSVGWACTTHKSAWELFLHFLFVWTQTLQNGRTFTKKIVCFCFFDFNVFWRENDVTRMGQDMVKQINNLKRAWRDRIKSQLRGSFSIWFHFCSRYMIYIIYIYHIHFFNGNISSGEWEMRWRCLYLFTKHDKLSYTAWQVIRHDLSDNQLECLVMEITRPHCRPFIVSTWSGVEAE